MQKKFVYQSMKNRFGRKGNSWKAISFVSILAIFIGVLFGSLMIIFFSNNTVKQPTTDEFNPIHSNPINKDKNEPVSIAEKEKTSLTIPPFTAYGVQLGVFTEKENAESMRRTIAEKGINSLVLQEGINFILLAGIFGGEELAKVEGEKLSDLGIENFIKVVKLDEKEVDLPKENEAKVTEIIDLLQLSLKQLDDNTIVKWNNLMEFQEVAYLKEAASQLPNEHNLFLLNIWDYLKNIQ